MKHIKPLLIFFCLCIVSLCSAQDLMFLNDSQTPIRVKVYEVGVDQVKYRPWGDTTGPFIMQSNIHIKKVVMANGSVFKFKNNPIQDTNYTDQHNNAIKVNPMSPLLSHLAFSFEHSIKPGRSIEVGFGIIGFGVTHVGERAKGVFGRIGYKFITHPDYYRREFRYAHILKGGYIKPEVVLGSYDIEYDIYSYTYSVYSASRVGSYTKNITYGAALVNLGKQWVINDRFVCDVFVGLGCGFAVFKKLSTGSREVENDEYYHYALMGGFETSPIAISGGIKLGYAFGKQKHKVRS